MAKEQYPGYVSDCRIKFLRAERYNISLAAKRILYHFQIKLELFGQEVLGREILLSDFNTDDNQSLKMGYLQVLPQSDFSGRRVVFFYKAISGCYRYRENIVSW